MTDPQCTLPACLQKARELRITGHHGQFLLTKVPDIHEYRLINCHDHDNLRLWLLTRTHKFVCFVDTLDILLIEPNLPFYELHSLFTRCETLHPEKRTCVDLTDFLELIKQEQSAPPSTISN